MSNWYFIRVSFLIGFYGRIYVWQLVHFVTLLTLINLLIYISVLRDSLYILLVCFSALPNLRGLDKLSLYISPSPKGEFTKEFFEFSCISVPCLMLCSKHSNVQLVLADGNGWIKHFFLSAEQGR